MHMNNPSVVGTEGAGPSTIRTGSYKSHYHIMLQKYQSNHVPTVVQITRRTRSFIQGISEQVTASSQKIHIILS